MIKPSCFQVSDKPKVDPLSKFLAELGVRRLAIFSEKCGLSVERLEEYRDDRDKPIRYLKALQIVTASNGDLTMEKIFARDVPDRAKYDTPLGRKVALSILHGPTLTEVLGKHGITHVEFGRWLTENVKWTKATRDRIKKAFSLNGVEITDRDFDEHKVDRLRVRYEEAREELEKDKVKA